MKPKFSILVAVYNAAPYLPRCLQSLLAQTEPSFEVICANDCSTDNSLDILKDFAQKDSRIRIVTMPYNKGQAHARNVALQQAEGEFTLMLDADDYLASDALELLWKAHLQYPKADALAFKLLRAFDDGRLEEWKNGDGRKVLTGYEACLMSIDWRLHGYYAVSTPIHKQYPYDTSCRVYSDDNTVRIHYLHSRLVVVTEARYYYWQHELSVTHKFNYSRLDFIDANRSLRRQLESNNAGEEALRICELHCWRVFIGVFGQMHSSRKSFSVRQNKVARMRFARALSEMHPDRLPLSVRLKPGYAFTRSLCLFSLQYRALCLAKAVVKRFHVLIPLLVVLFASCLNGGGYKASDDRRRADSLEERLSLRIMSNPRSAVAAIDSLQASITDSLAFYGLETFRGSAYKYLGKDSAAEKAYRRVRTWGMKGDKHEYLLGKLDNHLAVYNMVKGRYGAAEPYLQSSYKHLMSAEKVRKDVVNVCMNLATCNLQAGHADLAAMNYRRAMFLSDSLKYYDAYLAILTGLGQIYTELHNFVEAKIYLDEGKKFLSTSTDYDKSLYYNTLGNYHYFSKDYGHALEAFGQASQVLKRLENKAQEIVVFGNIGEIYLLQDSLEKASHYLHLSKRMADANLPGDSSTIFYLNSLLADLALRQNNIKEARKYLSQHYDYSKLRPGYVILHYDRLRRLALALGDYNRAYKYIAEERKWEDSLRNIRAMNNVAEIDRRYEQDTTLLGQKAVISHYQAITSRFRTYMVAAGSGILVILLGGGFLFKSMKLKNERRLQKQKDLLASLRMGIVRNRISPHYVFNVLGAVLPKFRAYPELEEPLSLLIGVLRGNLLASDKTAVPFADELALVKNFVRLRGLTYGGYPRVAWRIDDNIDYSLEIPAMCLQIPVENALKHAFDKPSEGDEIAISIRMDNDCLKMQVADNGRGFNPAALPSTERDTGTGLLVISRTVALLNSRNSKKIGFGISNKSEPEHGTIVDISIPQGYNYEL